MINSTYAPVRNSDFEAHKLNFDALAASSTVVAGSVTNIDLAITDDMFMTGVYVITNNGNYGDTVSFQVVDAVGTYYPPGTVLNTFITGWYVPAQMSEQLDVGYPAKVFGGLTLRLVYTSTGSSNVFVAINYKLHKVMV